MTAPLLEAEEARIDDAGTHARTPAPAVDGLTLRTTGEHVLILGAPRALFEAASGVRDVAHGALRVRGEDPREALRALHVAGAPLDPALPPAWTATKYVTWSARLSGHARAPAAALARDAIDRMRIRLLAEAPLARATPQMRRGIVIAAALATGAPLLALEDPLLGLPDDQARSLSRVIVEALSDRSWLIFASRIAMSSPLSLQADEALVLARASVAAQGAPAEIAARGRAYALRVHGETAAFARRVNERGGAVGGTTTHMTVDLGALTTRELMAIALESNAVIVELWPVSSAFA
jgi:ABC-type multidrug transport system ATPase subunit